MPGDVDILIAGTSCVDFSNMNTQRKELGADKGESSQTFFGMLGWVRRHRPPIIVQENPHPNPNPIPNPIPNPNAFQSDLLT